jgi:hypothetical protein
VTSVRHELELPLGILAVNGVLPPLFSQEEREALGHVALADAPKNPAESAVIAGARRAVQESEQAVNLERLLAGAALPHVKLPYLFDDAATPQTIERLSKYF